MTNKQKLYLDEHFRQVKLARKFWSDSFLLPERESYQILAKNAMVRAIAYFEHYQKEV